jgi:hypothetical protein
MNKENIVSGDILIDPEGNEYNVITFSSRGEPIVKDPNGNRRVLDKDLRCYNQCGGFYKKKQGSEE